MEKRIMNYHQSKVSFVLLFILQKEVWPNSSQKFLKEFKLTFTQYVTLLILWQEQKPVKMSEITSHLQLGYGTTSPLFKRMEKNEWITRNYSPEDKRKVYIELTEKAKKRSSMNALKNI
jgi:Transcriptional regulators